MEIPRVTLQANSHSFKNLAILIYLMVTAGSIGMAITIFLGAPVIVSMVALIAPMIIVVGFTSGKTEYVLGPEYLEKEIITFLNAKRIYKKYTWSAVKSFKEGSDMNRRLEAYDYIEVTFYGGEIWQMTDQKDKIMYPIFKQVFLQAVTEYNNGTLNKSAAGTPPVQATSWVPAAQQPVIETTNTTATSPQKVITTTHSPFTAHNKIVQKKTFYETVWAKVFFWVMVFFAVSVSAFLAVNPQYMSFSTAFKLGFVIVPGLTYVAYRIFIKK